MEQYKVIIYDKAIEDMEGIYTYISETLVAPIAAMNQYNRIADAILSLEQMPERVRLMYSEPEHSKGIRSLPVDNYAVFFVINDKAVNVLRVLYGASDISKRLLEE
jgi:plasmid stabilization system protein ParE